MTDDTIQVFPIHKKLSRTDINPTGLIGWRFRMLKAGSNDAMLTSEGLYPDADLCEAVAEKFNDGCYKGHYKIKRVTA